MGFLIVLSLLKNIRFNTFAPYNVTIHQKQFIILLTCFFEIFSVLNISCSLREIVSFKSQGSLLVALIFLGRIIRARNKFNGLDGLYCGKIWILKSMLQYAQLEIELFIKNENRKHRR